MKKNDLRKFVLISVMFPASLFAANITGTVTTPATGGGGGGGGGATAVNGVKIILLDNTTTGPKQDSATSAGGTYTLTNPGANGQKVLLTSQPGYNKTTTVFAYNGTALAENISLAVNNNTSTLLGKVIDSLTLKPIDSAIVTLSGGVLTTPVSVRTDTGGNYALDSIGTSNTRYTITVSSAKYEAATKTLASVKWDTTYSLPRFALLKNLGKLSGTVQSSATGNPAIKTGVSVVIYAAGIKVDSIHTDTLGNYADSLNAALYTVTFSAPGYKSDSDLAALDTFVTVVFKTNTSLNVRLTPATASLGGQISIAGVTPPPSPAGIALTLQRRMSATGPAATSFINVDSTTTDGSGLYDFINLIAGTTTNYRVHIHAVLSAGTVDTNTANTSVASGGVVTLNFTLNAPVSLFAQLPTEKARIRFTSLGSQLSLNLGQAAQMARTVSIFNMSGALQREVSVPAGLSQVTVPATFSPTNGFLFLVK